VTSFANAPEATLYGAEVELQSYLPRDSVFQGKFFASRRAVLIGNYTFAQSEIKVSAGDTTEVFGTVTQPASHFFVDGTALTGQSDHLVNLQIGLADTGRLSQQTLLLSYASDRVTSRGAAATSCTTTAMTWAPACRLRSASSSERGPRPPRC
jgi:hypothetical protein